MSIGKTAGLVASLVIIAGCVGAFIWAKPFSSTDEDRHKDYLANLGVPTTSLLVKGGSKRRKRSYKNRKSKKCGKK